MLIIKAFFMNANVRSVVKMDSVNYLFLQLRSYFSREGFYCRTVTMNKFAMLIY